MPWMETHVVKERLAFVHDLTSGHWSMTELCERYGVSRPTGYKWLARHAAEGRAGLDDRSRAPQWCPHRTTDALEALIVAARREYGWGAKKLLRVLRTRHPHRVWPARSTVNAILERHALLHGIGAGRSGRTPARPRSRRTGRIRSGPRTSRASS
jgi:putative transposase